jgi:hypothetical protein
MNKISEALLATLLGGIISFLSSIVFTYFTDNSAIINVGSSTKISDSEYILPIQVSTFKTDIEKLRIDIPIIISQEQIRSNSPLKISTLNNNIGTSGGSVFEISNIPTNKNIQIVINTNQQITENELEIYDDQIKADTEYLYEKESPLYTQLKTFSLNAIIYALFFGLTTYITLSSQEKRRKKTLEDIDNTRAKIEDLKKENEETEVKWKKMVSDAEKTSEKSILESNKLSQKVSEFEAHLEKIKSDSIKKQILLLAKLNDYRKELNFWRNTIRKILYNQTDNQSADKLFKTVSSTLKTYQTNEKQEHDFESLKVLSEYIKDMDKDI